MEMIAKRPVRSESLYYLVCVTVLFFVSASASFSGFYRQWHFREIGVRSGTTPIVPERNYGLAAMLDGTAARPYVYRQLIPTIANQLDAVMPSSMKDSLFHFLGGALTQWGESPFDSPLALSPTYFVRFLVVYVVTFLFVVLSVYAMYFVCAALEYPPVVCVFAPVLMILAFPYALTVGGYFYDYSELAFLALAVYMALKVDWWWMIPLVALAAWNKESFLFIALTLYPILRKRNSRISAVAGTSLLVLTCGIVYLSVRSWFSHNPGGTVLMYWHDQIQFFLNPAHLFDLDWYYGVVAFRTYSLFSMSVIVWTLWRGWRLLPVEIQRHGMIAVILNVPLFILFCWPGETRDFSMLYIVFMLALAANLNQWISTQAARSIPA